MANTGLYPAAQAFMQNPGMGMAPFQQTAAFTEPTVQSWRQGMGAASDIAKVGSEALNRWQSGWENVQQGNPYLNDVIDNFQDRSWQGFRRGTQNMINQDMLDNNSFGSTRHGIAQGVAMGDQTRSVNDSIAEMMMKGHQMNINAQGNLLSQAPNLMNSFNTGRLAPFQMMQNIGAQQQGQNQALLNEGTNRWNYYRDLPFQRLSQYNQLLNPGAMSGYGTTTAPNPNQQNPWAGAIGGAMTGYSMGDAMSTGNYWNSLNGFGGAGNAHI